jgi:hypothetical protein
MTAGSVPSFVGHNDLPRNLIIWVYLGPKVLFLEICFIVAGLGTDCGWMTSNSSPILVMEAWPTALDLIGQHYRASDVVRWGAQSVVRQS